MKALFIGSDTKKEIVIGTPYKAGLCIICEKPVWGGGHVWSPETKYFTKPPKPGKGVKALHKSCYIDLVKVGKEYFEQAIKRFHDVN